jgi:TIR domain
MSVLDMGLQVVTWCWTPAGFRCDGYVGVPSPTPAFVMLWPTGSRASEAACSRIAQALARRLAQLPGARRAHSMPCSGSPFPPDLGLFCHALRVQSVRKLLVVVADPATPLTKIPDHPGTWLRPGDDSFRVLAALPFGSKLTGVVPAAWQYQEAAFWNATPEEVVPDILRAAGIEESERRIFISYVRKESTRAADQIFDELNRRGFDVYLDRFRGQPGADFRQKLVRELAHKSMVLLLATPGVSQSRWTMFELLFARLYGLGILAFDLSAAFGTKTSTLGLPLVSSEVKALPQSSLTVRRHAVAFKKAAVSALGEDIVAAHTQALLERRQRLVLAADALLRHVGARVLSADPSGWVVAGPNGTAKPYSIRVSPRPAELVDFYLSHAHASRAKPVVAAPASREHGAARDSFRWLEGVSKVPLVEEGNWLLAARDIAKGVL